MITLTLLISYHFLYKVLISVIILIITTRFQISLMPYQDPKFNEIELLGTYAGAFTLFTGIIFADEDSDVEWVNLCLFIAIVIVNIMFLAQWFYLYVVCMSDRYKIFVKLLHVLDIIY